MSEIKPMDCGDNSCVCAETKGGMRTNGGCRCFNGLSSGDAHRARMTVQYYRAALAASEAEGERRRSDTLALRDTERKLVESEEECERLSSMIVAFCASQSWAESVWKNQEHIKPLFDFAEERRSSAEED